MGQGDYFLCEGEVNMLGLVMEIMMFIMGIFYAIKGELSGVILIGIVIILQIIGLIWDKIQFKDPLYSWKQLIRAFK